MLVYGHYGAIPSGFALLCGFFDEKGSHSTPVVQAIFHDGRLEDLIFAVPPHTSLDKYTHHFPLSSSAKLPCPYAVLPAKSLKVTGDQQLLRAFSLAISWKPQ